MKPPDKEEARHGGNPASLKTDSARSGKSKPTGGRPANQENRPARNPSQPAPKWRELPGDRAMRLLERLWGRR